MMKKIITSAAVAAALTTVAFAGSASFVGGAFTYSKSYVAEADRAFMFSDVNASAHIDLNTTATINNKNLITVVLEGGAKFNGEASQWGFLDVNSSKIVASGVEKSTDGATIKFVANSNTLPAGNGANLVFTKAGSTTPSTDLNLTIGKASTSDIKMKITGFDSENQLNLDGVKSELTLLKAGDSTLTATFKSDPTNGKETIINPDDKTKFLVNSAISGAATATTTQSYMMIPRVKPADIDFNYSDMNLTLSVTGGNFTDGNISVTNTPYTSSTISNTVSTTYTGRDLVAADVNDTLTYTLKGTSNVLTSVNFDFAVEAIFRDGRKQTITKATDTADLKFTLNSYVATVLSLRTNPTAGKRTFLVAYNNTDVETKVTISFTNPDGSNGKVDMGTIGKQSSAIYTAEQIMAKDTTIQQGFKAVVSLDNIPAAGGDLVAFQNSSFGQVNLRVVDNNGKSKGL